MFFASCFNTQPPEGGWLSVAVPAAKAYKVSTHSRPKAAGHKLYITTHGKNVSTHSRPKAAGLGFHFDHLERWFQHTAARRRLVDGAEFADSMAYVSTHSRPKAAGGRIRKAK